MSQISITLPLHTRPLEWRVTSPVRVADPFMDGGSLHWINMYGLIESESLENVGRLSWVASLSVAMHCSSGRRQPRAEPVPGCCRATLFFTLVFPDQFLHLQIKHSTIFLKSIKLLFSREIHIFMDVLWFYLWWDFFFQHFIFHSKTFFLIQCINSWIILTYLSVM